MTRTQCVTFTEQHVLWSVLLKHYSVTEPATAEALRMRYFIKIPVEQAMDPEGYGVIDPIFVREGNMLCALFWCGLQRLQPGSACGSQPCESNHKTWLQPLLQAPDGTPLKRATPPTLFPALRTAIRTMSRQYAKIKSIPSRPTSPDPALISGTHLERQGRSTAAALHRAATGTAGFIRTVDAPDWGPVEVLPRSLLKLVPGRPGQEASWVAQSPESLTLTTDRAGLIVEVALEKSCKR